MSPTSKKDTAYKLRNGSFTNGYQYLWPNERYVTDKINIGTLWVEKYNANCTS